VRLRNKVKGLASTLPQLATMMRPANPSLALRPSTLADLAPVLPTQHKVRPPGHRQAAIHFFQANGHRPLVERGLCGDTPSQIDGLELGTRPAHSCRSSGKTRLCSAACSTPRSAKVELANTWKTGTEPNIAPPIPTPEVI
jgi:hypothetical protein